MVMEVVQEDMSEGSMQCTSHPFKNSNTPAGGICAFCLQEKLGKLVSSSSPVAIFPSSSSSPSPSFRSDFGIIGTTTNPSSALSLSSNNARKAKLPFLLTQRKKKKLALMAATADASNIVFKRSISTVASRNASHFMDAYDSEDYNSPQRKRFWWSFLYLQRKSERVSGGNLMNSRGEKKKRDEQIVVVDENDDSPPDEARRVSRSRSVGCGSRSFSGDFFERISTGFGDCTLRRVESQREGKSRIHSLHRNSIGGGVGSGQERVKCGGIFSGFTITSSSSSSSSSYLVSSNEDTNNFNNVKKTATTPSSHHHHHHHHPRSKSWGWALASPMRVFSKQASSIKNSTTTSATPNLAAIPSLLVGG